MHVLLGILVVAACLYLLSRAIRNARGSAWAGPRTPAMRSRAAAPRSAGSGRGRTALRSAGSAGRSLGAVALHPGSREHRAAAKADAHRMWQEAFATDWLEQQRHQRANGTPAAAGGAATATAAPPTIRQRLRLAPPAQGPDGNAGTGSGTNGTDSTGGNPVAYDPDKRRTENGWWGLAYQGPLDRGNMDSAPMLGRTGRSSGTRTNGGTSVAAPSTAGAEQLVEGINRIHSEAAAGGIRHKQAALKSANEASLRFSAMAQMISRTMSEPGNNYGPEITEPLGQAAQHLQAAAMSFGESDNALTSLIHMTVGELADSPRQAPHHSELSENGSH